MNTFESLLGLGWHTFFFQQLSLEEWEQLRPVRVVEQNRSILEVVGADYVGALQIRPSFPPLTVGDWLLLDDEENLVRALDRLSCFERASPGHRKSETQLIGANIDTALILTSSNDDFSLNRLERYQALVNQAGAEPVVVLTKADLCEDPASYVEQVQAIDPALSVIALDSRDPSAVQGLVPWCKPGKTIALLGSSGVGKSTLTNTLLGDAIQDTAAIRTADSKGRHTTTRRSLLAAPGGFLLLDTPGMRELQLAESEAGIAATFADIEQLAERCRFADCSHENEPGCAVLKAVEEGTLEARRLDNFHKLSREMATFNATVAEKRAAGKSLGRFYKRTIKESMKLKRGN